VEVRAFSGPVLGITTAESSAVGIAFISGMTGNPDADPITGAPLPDRDQTPNWAADADAEMGAGAPAAADTAAAAHKGQEAKGAGVTSPDWFEGPKATADAPKAHLETLAPLIEQVLAEAGLKTTDLAAVAVGRGPAPYTGLRIGLATASALALGLGVELWGISDLDVMAAGTALHLDIGQGVSILATLDAKRREIYWARYRVDQTRVLDGLTRLEGPTVGPAATAPASSIVVGSGADTYPEALHPTVGEPQTVDPVLLARLACHRALRGEDVSATPLYLRRPDIAPPAPRKRATP
jgi:tRNA threonylcarbamoyladenosine biosynthesis protein TsaB